MEMKDLDALLDEQDADEKSVGRYLYPLRIGASIATKEGLRLATGIPENEVYRRGQFVCAKSPESHKGPFRWAVDFLVPDGTPVLAARDGRIVELYEVSSSWGPTAEYRDQLNYVTLRHADGEFTQYCHLTKDSVTHCRLRDGSRVIRGQQIGFVGKTGWTDRDHLHFVVLKHEVASDPRDPRWLKGLKVQFRPEWWFRLENWWKNGW
jgi:murein DD-endopeptidase MepM/ murein hydrolase activator NlpD